MAQTIGKKELEHLAKLTRIDIEPGKEEKLIKDLNAVLDYFKELQALDTENVTPMTGGTDLRNMFRGDTDRESTNQRAGTEAFPEKKDGYLKIPPVFE